MATPSTAQRSGFATITANAVICGGNGTHGRPRTDNTIEFSLRDRSTNETVTEFERGQEYVIQVRRL